MPHLARRVAPLAASFALLLAAAGCGDGSPTSAGPTGRLVVQLTDAPFPYDQVSRVDVFVVRADAKREDTDEASAATRVGDDDKGADGWVTIAEPKAKIELTALRDGVTTALGTATLPAGTYRAFRLVIDPAQSSVTLKDGTVLPGTTGASTTPGVVFPSAGRSGVKIKLDRPVTVPATAEGTTPPTLLIDFDLNDSFEQRGSSLSRNGLLFKPGIKATPR